VASVLYTYFKVTYENRDIVQQTCKSVKIFRVKDDEVDRLLVGNLAETAAERYPGSREEGQFTKEDVIELLVKQNNLCVGCSQNIRYCFSIDHIIPRSRGGSNSPKNIQLLCRSCNSSKCDRSMYEWLSSMGYETTSYPVGQSIKELKEDDDEKLKMRREIMRGHRGILSPDMCEDLSACCPPPVIEDNDIAIQIINVRTGEVVWVKLPPIKVEMYRAPSGWIAFCFSFNKQKRFYFMITINNGEEELHAWSSLTYKERVINTTRLLVALGIISEFNSSFSP
jgi:hypothetical protein